MILETMTIEQIVKECQEDIAILHNSSTLKRLSEEYIKERKLRKIPHSAYHSKLFEIKSKRKNPWIIIFDGDNIKGANAWLIDNCLATYFYTSKGIRLVTIDHRNTVMIMNSHLFKRWNERLDLKVVQPLDMIKRFLTENNVLPFQMVPGTTNNEVFGSVKGGYLLGNKYNSKITIMKTFINHDLAGLSQLEIAENLKKNFNPELRFITENF